MGFLSDVLRGYRTLTSSGVAVPSRNVLECPDVTLTDDPVNARTVQRIFGSGVNATFSSVTATTVNIGTSFSESGFAPVTTTDGSTVNLGPAIPIPAGGVLGIQARAKVNLIGDGTNPGSMVAWLRIKAAAARLGSAAPSVAGGDDGSLTSAFAIASPFGTPAAGTMSGAIVGNSVQLQVTGLAFSSASSWAPGTSYTGGSSAVKNGGNFYLCIVSGTSAGSGGPSGTSANITDNTAHWCYVDVGKITVQWELILLETG